MDLLTSLQGVVLADLLLLITTNGQGLGPVHALESVSLHMDVTVLLDQLPLDLFDND